MNRAFRQWIGMLAVAAIMSSLVSGARAEDGDAVDPSGTWKLNIELDPQTPLTAIANIKKGDDGFTGTFNMMDGLAEGDITDISAEGSGVTFKVETDMQGQTLVADFEGKIEDGVFTGVVNYDLDGAPGTLDVKGELVPVDATGKWNIKITTEDGQTLESSLKVKESAGELSGTFLAMDGSTVESDEISLEGSNFKFQITLDFGGQDLVAMFNGDISGDGYAGTVEYDLGGAPGEADFDAARAKVEKVSAWDLKVTTEDGQVLESKLTVNKVDGDYEASFVGIDGTEIEPDEFSMEEDNMKFTITVDLGGQDLVATFDGKVDGDSYNGTVDYDLGGQPGELDFEGSAAEEE